MKHIDKKFEGDTLVIYLADFTDFEWDKMMVFNYPTSAEEVENALGIEYDKSMDLISGMIFVRNDEVVYDEVFEYNYTETA